MPAAQETRQYAPAQLRGVDAAARTVDIVASNFDLDSHGTRIDPNGWVLDRFKKNPVICLQHDSHGKTEAVGLPIANAIPETVRVENGQLKMKVRFPREGTFELADTVFNLIREGFLHGVSVGFSPDMDAFEQVEEEDKNGNPLIVDISRRHELGEVSFVTIPSNPGTLVQRAKALGREDELEKIVRMTKQVEDLVAKEESAGEALCWSRALAPLAARFDVSKQQVQPVNREYEWVAKHIGCKVKEVFQNTFVIPPYRFGGFLAGLKSALAGLDLADVRQLWGDREMPPEYRVIELNSRLSDDFLVDGTAFYKNDGEGGNLAYSIMPVWMGLRISVFTHREAKDFNKRIVDEAWRQATENNPLRGEAFSLGGEFVRKTAETWDDIFIEEKNSKALARVVDRVNEKGKATPNRGVILMGPPGTGKTLSGRIIRNTLKDCSFIWVSTRDIGYGGFSHAFDLAREISPSVLFFEDIDNWIGMNVDLLKTELDGIARSTGVVTIMTTNFPERLPEALIDRPGRFHDVLNFDVPTDEKRSAMLRKWVDGLTDADIENAVKHTKGYSGAHMYELASFTHNLMEADDLSVSEALREALKKVEEQKELITKVQLAGSNYQHPRRASVRGREECATMTPAMPEQSIQVRVADVPAVQEELSGLRSRVAEMEKDFDKYKGYFDNKQPANRAATKVLARFFRLKGEDPPEDEVKAWERMGEMLSGESTIEAPPDAPAAETVTATTLSEVAAPDTPAEAAPAVEPKTEETPGHSATEPVVPAAVVEEKPEEPTPPPTPEPAAEAPQPERKACVQIPLPSLLSLRQKVQEVRDEALVKASREGVPVSKWETIADAAVRQHLASISHQNHESHSDHRNHA